MQMKELLEAVRNQSLSIEDAMEQAKDMPYEDISYAKLDHHRQLRTGFPEVVFGMGKTCDQMREIFFRLYEKSGVVMATRVTRAQFEAVQTLVSKAEYHETAQVITACREPVKARGLVTVCCGGTADIPVAEEAVITAQMCGANVQRVYDIGVSGIHRLLSALPEIRKANAVVAIAGMEGALASVLAGQMDKPVIAVPTSVGYGANLHGIAALLTMINSCATGISVVNIDNGFSGGYMAAQINRLVEDGVERGKREHE